MITETHHSSDRESTVNVECVLSMRCDASEFMLTLNENKIIKFRCHCTAGARTSNKTMAQSRRMVRVTGRPTHWVMIVISVAHAHAKDALESTKMRHDRCAGDAAIRRRPVLFLNVFMFQWNTRGRRPICVRAGGAKCEL